jgi:hypothetical protein
MQDQFHTPCRSCGIGSHQIGDPSASNFGGSGMLPTSGIPGYPGDPRPSVPSRCFVYLEIGLVDSSLEILNALNTTARPMLRSRSPPKV